MRDKRRTVFDPPTSSYHEGHSHLPGDVRSLVQPSGLKPRQHLAGARAFSGGSCSQVFYTDVQPPGKNTSSRVATPSPGGWPHVSRQKEMRFIWWECLVRAPSLGLRRWRALQMGCKCPGAESVLRLCVKPAIWEPRQLNRDGASVFMCAPKPSPPTWLFSLLFFFFSPRESWTPSCHSLSGSELQLSRGRDKAYRRDTAGSVPEHPDKVNTTIKQAIWIFWVSRCI